MAKLANEGNETTPFAGLEVTNQSAKGEGKMITAVRELWAAIVDSWHQADLMGHLSAWWEVATGRVEVE
jgi:hypothetical protein